jgi:7-carboxy-7-deazaguanine synthase
MSADDIFAHIEELSSGEPILVSLSGGNPAIQPLGDLIKRGKEKGYRFTLETQGSIAADWFADLDLLTLSPKPPSSAMKTDWSAFDECLKAAGNGPDISMKIVIFDETDYAYAKDAATRYPDLPLYLQPGNHQANDNAPDIDALNDRLLWLVDTVTKDKNFNATILPQLHVILWGNKKGV